MFITRDFCNIPTEYLPKFEFDPPISDEILSLGGDLSIEDFVSQIDVFFIDNSSSFILDSCNA